MHTSTRHGGTRTLWATLLLALIFALGAVSTQAAVLINELDSDTVSIDALEFIELYGSPNEALDGLVLVFFNGSDDASYVAYDLDGYTCDANGFFLLGNADVVPTPSIIFPGNHLQNGADAVGLYTGNDADFPNDTPVTTTNMLDAIVYDTSDDDDAGLLILTPGQPQINENENGNKDTESCQRIPDGDGGGAVTTSYVVQAPTPGASNGGVLPQPPSVNNVYHRALLPIPGEAVTVYADITDSDGTIASASVYYQFDGGGYATATMTLDTGDTYTGTIPAGTSRRRTTTRRPRRIPTMRR